MAWIKPRIVLAVLLASLALVGGICAAGPLTITDNGVGIDCKAMGQFTLSYPVLCNASDSPVHPVIEVDKVGSSETIRYQGGSSATATLNDAGVDFKFSNLPADAVRFKMLMLIDISFGSGGRYRVDQGAEGRFPEQQAEKANFLQSNGVKLAITDSSDRTLTIESDLGSYFQLTDNRQWHWKVFQMMLLAPFASGRDQYHVGIGLPSAPDRAVVLYDRYGQPVLAQYPDKISSDDELKRDVAVDDAYYSTQPSWPFDEYGGQPGSGKALGLTATGYFRVQQARRRWIMVDPAGNAYFLSGLCELGLGDDYTDTAGRESAYEWIPPRSGDFASAYMKDQSGGVVSFYVANLIRKYGKPFDGAEWTARAVARAKGWGFNASGPFGAANVANPSVKLPYVLILPISPWSGVKYLPGSDGIWDPFDDQNRAALEKNFSAQVSQRAGDPLLIGYYLGNEPLFEDLPTKLPQLSGQYACKREFVKFLQDRYSSIDRYNAAWAKNASSFDSLADAALPVATDAARADVHAFTARYFEAYYRLVAETFHKYDRNHLLLGDRLQSGTIDNEQLLRIASKYMDVISFNYYTCALDRDFLARIYGWTGRPMLLSEYYFDSPGSSGLPGGLLDMQTQQLRGLAYRHYVEHAAATPFVVGTSWFTLVDQSVSGRWFEKYNGEKANSGLLAVTDRPYKDMLGEMTLTNDGIYDVFWGKKAAYTLDDARFAGLGPLHNDLAVERAVGPVAMDGAAAGFPGAPAALISPRRLALGSDADQFSASFRLCWDDANLYFLGNVVDPTPARNELSGSNLWEGDCVELFIGQKDLQAVGHPLPTDAHILLGASASGDAGKVWISGGSSQGIKRIVLPFVDGKGYTIEAAIPFAALGIAPAPGEAMRFDVAVDDSSTGQSRQRQIVWNGDARDSGDRTNWGTAHFVK